MIGVIKIDNFEQIKKLKTIGLIAHGYKDPTTQQLVLAFKERNV